MGYLKRIYMFTLLEVNSIQRAGTMRSAKNPVPSTVPTPTSLLVRKVAKMLTNSSGDEEAAAINVAPATSGLKSSPEKYE